MLVGEGRRREGARCDAGGRSRFRVQDDAVQELGQSSVEEQFRRGTDALPGDAIKRDPERENCAVLTIAAQTANSIHIRVTFNAVTR